jgi:hypothetical protein
VSLVPAYSGDSGEVVDSGGISRIARIAVQAEPEDHVPRLDGSAKCHYGNANFFHEAA